MNQKHVLPYPKFLVFLASSLPQSFSLLPTSLTLTSPSYLPPTYLPPPTYLTSFCTQSIIRAWERLKWESPSLKLGSAWSETQDNTLQVGARTDRPEWELEGKLLPLSSFPSLFGSVATNKAMAVIAIAFFFFFLFSIATKKVTTILAIAFFFLVLL